MWSPVPGDDSPSLPCEATEETLSDQGPSRGGGGEAQPGHLHWGGAAGRGDGGGDFGLFWACQQSHTFTIHHSHTPLEWGRFCE